MTLAFPPNDCGGIELEAIEWPYLDELQDCVLADVPDTIRDFGPPPFPQPIPYRLRNTPQTTTTTADSDGSTSEAGP